MIKLLDSSEEIDNGTSVEEEQFDIIFPYPLRFWLYFISFVISLFWYIFVLLHMLLDRGLRQTLSNHTIIVLLIVNIIYELISIPMFLSYFHYHGVVYPSTPATCLVWLFIDEGLFSVSLFLVAWASIERYILIFHGQWVATRRQQFLVHYLPLACLLIYLLVFYFFTITFPPCENDYEYNEIVCGSPLCYYDVPFFGLWDTIVLDIFPILVIVIFNLALLFRVLIQKHRFNQRIEWRKYRKMTVQLLAISCLYSLLHIPEMIVELIELISGIEDYGAEFQSYCKFFSYYTAFLLPVVTAVSLPNVKGKLSNIFLCRWKFTNENQAASATHGSSVAHRTNAIRPKTQQPSVPA